MSVDAHLQELRKKHYSLSQKVEEAQRSPGSDDLEVAALKKRKLLIKEEIVKLSEEI